MSTSGSVMNAEHPATRSDPSPYSSTIPASLTNCPTHPSIPTTHTDTNINKLFSLIHLDKSAHDKVTSNGEKWRTPLSNFYIPTDPALESLAGAALVKIHQNSLRETREIKIALDTYLRGSTQILPYERDQGDSEVPEYRRAVKSRASLWRVQDMLLDTLSQCKSAGYLSDMAQEQDLQDKLLRQREAILDARDKEWTALKTEEAEWKSSAFYKAYSTCQSVRSGVGEGVSWIENYASAVSGCARDIGQRTASAYHSAGAVAQSWLGGKTRTSLANSEDDDQGKRAATSDVGTG